MTLKAHGLLLLLRVAFYFVNRSRFRMRKTSKNRSESEQCRMLSRGAYAGIIYGNLREMYVDLCKYKTRSKEILSSASCDVLPSLSS